MNSFNTEDFFSMFLKKSTMRKLCLVSQSKENMAKFQTRETFAETVVNSIALSRKVTVQH